MKGVSRAAAIGGAALALAGSAFAADQISGRVRAPAAATVTIDSSAPLFNEQGLTTGQSFDRCTVLTNEGPQPADVTLFGKADQADLSPWLDLDLVRGTLPPGTPVGDCTGFVPDAIDYGAGTDGVVYRGTLASLPDESAGIADPTRWSVGEQHAYLLRIHYTGDNPQQGLSTVQSFTWGATPFDDRAPDPFVDPAGVPASSPGDAAGASADPTGTPCTVVTFPARSYVGARAISRPKAVDPKTKAGAKATKAALAPLGSSAGSVIAAGENPATLGSAELANRAALLKRTSRTASRRAPVLVVRLTPSKGDTLSIRVGIRKNGKVTSPHRWKWVRIRINKTSTKTMLKWPYTAVTKMSQLKVGYNQVDMTLNRGPSKQRVKGYPWLLHRSFAFVVGQPSTTTTAASSTCTLG